MNSKKAFLIEVDGRKYDYRLGKNLDLKEVAKFFSQKYRVKNIWQDQRHVLGCLEKNSQNLFLKLSTTTGIGLLTEKEKNWNDFFNRQTPRNASFWVPINVDFGYFNGLFYLITDELKGEKLHGLIADNEKISGEDLRKVMKLSLLIQNLKTGRDAKDDGNCHRVFLNKTKLWFSDIPKDVVQKYNLKEILELIWHRTNCLPQAPRHGDFAPWHILKMKNNLIGLIDGEHFLENGVAGYDICYFIQRLYGVLNQRKTADAVVWILKENNNNIDKLKTVLYARAIGGFLDESLKQNPDYQNASDFIKWIAQLR
jgi:hypothetical protein